jgi:hypothetical protein
MTLGGMACNLATLQPCNSFNPQIGRPTGTWQIDPFGHSNTQAWLLSAEVRRHGNAPFNFVTHFVGA